MNKIKIYSLHLIISLITVVFFFSVDLFAQNYILMNDGFENMTDSSWTLKNAVPVNTQSYKGQQALEISGNGRASYILDLPFHVNEIVLKGWIHIIGKDRKNEKNKSITLYIEAQNDKSKKIFTAIPGGSIEFTDKNSNWTEFENEIKLPVGTKKIKLVCKNTFDHTIAYLDELVIEKRQTGFVKKETAWSETVKQFNEANIGIIPNGNFEFIC